MSLPSLLYSTLPRGTIFPVSTFVFAALILMPAVASASWWNCDRLYRSEITVSASGTAADYPVQLTLQSADFHPDYTFSDRGDDLLVVDADDTTELSFFVDHWDAAARQATISVNVPLLSAAPRTIYLYYGMSAGTYTVPAIPSSDAPATFVESGWRMHTRYTTIDPTSEQEGRSLFAGIDDTFNGYGCAATDTLNGRNNRNTFNGPNGRYGLLAETHFYVTAPGEWSFRMGSDFGLGGGLYVNGVALDERWNDDLWWAFNWNNPDVLVGSIFLQSGYHHIEALGYEGCCDGSINLQYRSAASTVWRDMDNNNLTLYGRSCPPGVIDQSTTQTASPTFFRGNVFYDNGADATAHDGIRTGTEEGTPAIDVTATVVSAGSSSSDQSNANGEWSVCFLDEAAGNDVSITATLPSNILAVSESSPYGNASPATDNEIVLQNVADTNHDDIMFGVIEQPALNADRAIELSPNASATLLHTYRATSTADVNFQISLQQQTPAMAFSYIGYRDADCDGVVEQPPATLTNPISVVAGEKICLVIIVNAGNSVDAHSSLTLQIDSESNLSNTAITLALHNTDTIYGRSPGQLSLDKRVCNSSTHSCDLSGGNNFGYSNVGLPGDTLQYRILFSSSENDVSEVTITDSVPWFTTLDPLSISVERLPAGVNCTLDTPANQSISNYKGPIEWRCDGTVSPADFGIVTFSVVVD